MNEKQIDEKLPISEFYKVIDQTTIFRSKEWWEAIVLIESFGRRSIAIYLWQKNKEGQWKRKHKFQLKNMEEWNKIKKAIDDFMPKLGGQSE